MKYGIVFLTGQSDPRTCELSDAQKAFGEKLIQCKKVQALVKNNLEEKNTIELFPLNFPYQSTSRKFPPVSLLKASYANTRMYFASRTSGFTRLYRHELQNAICQFDKTLLLVGSSGMEILQNLQPEISEKNVSILAYGSVARLAPPKHCVLVVGKKDWLSRMLYPYKNTAVNCGHMDYLASEEFFTIACNLLLRLVSRGA